MFAWRYLDERGRDVGTSQRFEDQEAAESWLERDWRILRQRGVEEVVLLESDQAAALYRMALGPESG